MGVCFARHSRWTRGHWRLLDCEAPDFVRFGDVAGRRHRPWTVLSGIGWRSRGLRSAWLVSGQPVATQRSVSATPAVRQLVLRELSWETVIPANRSVSSLSVTTKPVWKMLDKSYELPVAKE